jgi:probable H4MPT-linked C1 transfer pathway protein
MPASPAATDLVALDVGGAAIKAADGRGGAWSMPFAMWREWQRLPEAIVELVGPLRPARLVATMTGEIADCYPSRAAGVVAIVAALEEAARMTGSRAPVGIYLLDGRIVPAAEAVARPHAAAAANWHAVARLAAGLADGRPGLLVDVGSTTTDIVPFSAAGPEPLATDDAGRMRSGELVYTGVERTPLATLVRSLSPGGLRRPLASERFAESRDVWLVLGGLPEGTGAGDTADGAPATRAAARVRIARSMLVEPDAFTAADAEAAAGQWADAQARLVARALRRVAAGRGLIPEVVVLSGHGTALAVRGLALTGWDAACESLSDRLGPSVSRVAPAHALAAIARGDLP